MNTKNLFLTLLLLTIFPLNFYARTSALDSLLNFIPLAKDNIDKTYLYEAVADQYNFIGNTEKAKEYHLKQRDLSEKLNYLVGVWRGTVGYCDILSWTGKYDSVLMLYKEIAPRIEASGDKLLMIKLTGNMGEAYYNKGFFELAIDYYLKALRELEKMDKAEGIEGIAIYNSSLHRTYSLLGLYDKALIHAEKAVEAAKECNYMRYNACLARLGQNHCILGNYDTAEKILLKVVELTDSEPDMFARGIALTGLARVYFDKKDYDKAEKYSLENLEICMMTDYSSVTASSLFLLGQIKFQQKDFKKSEEYALQALEIATRDSMYIDIHDCLNLLADIDIVNGNFSAMFEKRNQADSIYRIVINDRVHQASEELSVKYETEKKDIQIAALAKEKRLYILLMVAGCILALLILGILLYRNRLHRRQKQLLAAHVALESETAERSRLAKDLHDGLGGMLSLVKINLSDMKGMKVIEQADGEHFNKALDMLDNSIIELRRVAHHIMPESLLRNGLKTSLEDFSAAVPGAEFHFFGEEKRLDKNLEIMLYRSAHELVNNALKHSGASHILIQIVQETNRIALTVQDNGCGFEPSDELKGMGLSNIRNRVAAYNGSIMVDSKPGKGTEISIEMKIDNSASHAKE